MPTWSFVSFEQTRIRQCESKQACTNADQQRRLSAIGGEIGQTGWILMILAVLPGDVHIMICSKGRLPVILTGKSCSIGAVTSRLSINGSDRKREIVGVLNRLCDCHYRKKATRLQRQKESRVPRLIRKQKKPVRERLQIHMEVDSTTRVQELFPDNSTERSPQSAKAARAPPKFRNRLRPETGMANYHLVVATGMTIVIFQGNLRRPESFSGPRKDRNCRGISAPASFQAFHPPTHRQLLHDCQMNGRLAVNKVGQ